MLRIALCQLPLDIENPSENNSMAEAAIRESAAAGAQLILLPELTNSGYVFQSKQEVAARATKLDSPLMQRWSALVRELDIVLVVGLAIEEEGIFYNASAIFDASGLCGWYKKVHLWNDEVDFFTAGEDGPLIVETKVGKIATMVCYDVEFPEWVRLAMLGGAAILAIPTNWPDGGLEIQDTPMEAVRIQAAASQNKMVIAAADRTGLERGVSWTSSSVLVDSDGLIKVIAARNNLPERQILIADVEIPSDLKVGPRNDIRGDRRPELYKKILIK